MEAINLEALVVFFLCRFPLFVVSSCLIYKMKKREGEKEDGKQRKGDKVRSK